MAWKKLAIYRHIADISRNIVGIWRFSPKFRQNDIFPPNIIFITFDTRYINDISPIYLDIFFHV